MKKKMTITQRRQIIGVLLFIFATIQIINFANINFEIIKIFPELFSNWVKYDQRPLIKTVKIIISIINYPFIFFNHIIYRLFGWAGLLSPFFFYILGYTFFRKRTKRFKRMRQILFWSFGEITFLTYVINYILYILPFKIRSGIIAWIFTRYLKKIGGVFFIIIFFTWSLTAYILFLRQKSWKSFFRSLKKILFKVILMISNLFSSFAASKKITGKQKQINNNIKEKPIKLIEKQETASNRNKKENKTNINETEKTQNNISEENDIIIEPEYEIRLIKEFDSTKVKYNFPFDSLNTNRNIEVSNEEIDNLKSKILEIFNSFGITLNQTGLTVGPQILRFEYEIPSGMQIKEIEKYKNDLSYRIGGLQVNIEVPIPGTNSFGIYIPRSKPDLLGMGSYIKNYSETDAKIPVFIGISSDGKDIWTDAAGLPHLLIAGATGSGKSVFLNSLIVGFIAVSKEIPINLILIDPKCVEFSPYKNIKQLATPITTDVNQAKSILAELEKIMEERYSILSNKHVRNIDEYNKESGSRMPYIFVVIDEFADIILQDTTKNIKNSIVRLAQKSRAVGIHLILATQRPSTDVIDGLIKANFPSRIAFKTSSQIDSRIIIDEAGAENLLGKGDMLFKNSTGKNYRLQGIYIGIDEIKKIV